MSRREDTQRRKVAKKLQEQITACTDPKLLVRLTKQYNALKPKKMGRPANPEVPTPADQPRTPPREKRGSFVDQLSDSDYRGFLVVERAEKIKRASRELSTHDAIQQAASELMVEGKWGIRSKVNAIPV